MGVPHFLLLEIAGEHGDQRRVIEVAADRVAAAGGIVFACEPAGRIASLEPGARTGSMVLARFDTKRALQAAVQQGLMPSLAAALPSGTTPTMLCVEGLPEEGLPDLLDIPTAASVPRPKSPDGAVLWVIRGTAWDQPSLDRYRDVILPMWKERGGLYEAFAVLPGQVEALSGTWPDQIFAIGRFPTRAAGDDFWYCDRYQTVAIPLRLGAGRFSVHVLAARA
jgi:uncharacterized protein (DUF1330 family)